MTSLSFRVKNLPAQADHILLAIKNEGETREFGMEVWPPPASWTSYPQTPYHNWGQHIRYRYIALKPDGTPVGDWKSASASHANWGDATRFLDYVTGAPGQDPSASGVAFAKLTYFNVPEVAVPGEQINVSITIKNIMDIGGYVYGHFWFDDGTQWIYKGRDKEYTWLNPRGEAGDSVIYSPEIPIVIPTDLQAGGVSVLARTYVATPGAWADCDNSQVSIMVRPSPPQIPAPQFRNITGKFT